MRIAYLGCGALLLLTTACLHGPCYTERFVESSGTFDDTLVAVSGSGSAPGTVSLYVLERLYSGRTSRGGDFSLNASGVMDSVGQYRVTLVSDQSREPLFTATRAGPFTVEAPTFNTLFVHLATENVLFEIEAPDGGVRKALLNLENRTGPREDCEPWT